MTDGAISRALPTISAENLERLNKLKASVIENGNNIDRTKAEKELLKTLDTNGDGKLNLTESKGAIDLFISEIGEDKKDIKEFRDKLFELLKTTSNEGLRRAAEVIDDEIKKSTIVKEPIKFVENNLKPEHKTILNAQTAWRKAHRGRTFDFNNSATMDLINRHLPSSEKLIDNGKINEGALDKLVHNLWTNDNQKFLSAFEIYAVQHWADKNIQDGNLKKEFMNKFYEKAINKGVELGFSAKMMMHQLLAIRTSTDWHTDSNNEQLTNFKNNIDRFGISFAKYLLKNGTAGEDYIKLASGKIILGNFDDDDFGAALLLYDPQESEGRKIAHGNDYQYRYIEHKTAPDVKKLRINFAREGETPRAGNIPGRQLPAFGGQH
ncbi:MAG: hypothetical protein HYY52_07100 [Candidatus Melainabacteria bacterium]|nr:hypothetical protein [Candidatus Melainabacteria bacterium]